MLNIDENFANIEHELEQIQAKLESLHQTKEGLKDRLLIQGEIEVTAAQVAKLCYALIFSTGSGEDYERAHKIASKIVGKLMAKEMREAPLVHDLSNSSEVEK